MFTLDYKLGIFTPSTGAHGRPIAPEELSNRVQLVDSKLTGLFGGCTSIAPGAPSVGSYNGDNGLIREDVILQLTWCTQEAYNQHYDYILAWASYLCRQWHQETIGVLDNTFQLHLISEEDYILNCTRTIIAPADYLEILNIAPEEGLSYYDNGYTLKSALYEEGRKE